MTTEQTTAGGAPDKPANGTSDVRDPHAAWWVEHRQINAELDTWSYSHPDEPDETGVFQARCDRVNELEDLLCKTPISTFEGANVLYDVLRHEQLADDLLPAGLYTLWMFVMSVESALRHHDMQDQVERWFWQHQCVEAPVWAGHPRQPIGLKYREQSEPSRLAELEEKVARLKGQLDSGSEAGLQS